MKPIRYIITLTTIILLVAAAFIVGRKYDTFSPPSEPGLAGSSSVAPAHTFEDLLDAIEWVESRDDPWAVGKDGELGAYQLRKIYVDDVNRIAAMNRLAVRMSYADRYDKDISRAATNLYLSYYGGTFEEMARKHNGGPNGHNKECTKVYWEKVKARMSARATWPSDELMVQEIE